jgi:2-polyprenyl-3-methyl-5-hydroxy-6-metoxy-1,4-benzoquinol methylase
MQISRAPRRHLEASELIDCQSKCPICLTPLPRPVVFRVQVDPDVYMLKCPNCHACSASHMPRPEVLSHYYSTYYDGRESEVTFSEPGRFAKHVVKSLPRGAFQTRARILDFGGGDGSLAKAVAEHLMALGRIRNADVLVVDFVIRENRADEGVSIRYQSPVEKIDGQYDLVLASAILEHIPHLHAVLQTLHTAMAPVGFFYARTPYVIPLARLFPRLDLTYPAHVHDMGSEFWNCFNKTFAWRTNVVESRPSVVAGRLASDPLRTLSAAVLKAPAHVEHWLSPRSRAKRFWNLVGGWEVLLQNNEARQSRAS